MKQIRIILFLILQLAVLATQAQYIFISNSKRVQLLDSLDKKIQLLRTVKNSFGNDTLLFNSLDVYHYHYFEINQDFTEQKQKMSVIPDSMYKIAKRIKWKKGVAIALLRQADATSYLGDKATAVALYQETIRISQLQKLYHEQSLALINLAICYAYRKNTTNDDWEKTVEYMDKALGIAQKHNDIENIHQYYNLMGDFHIIRKQYDKALKYYETEYPMLQKHKYMIGYRTNLAYLGICYLNTLQEEKAWTFLNRFFEISNTNEGSYATYLHYTVLNELGHYYLNVQKDYKKALQFQLQYAQNIHELPLFNVTSHYETMVKIYSGLKNRKKTVQYQKLYLSALDSLKLETTAKKFSEIENQLVIEKKENQIQMLKNKGLETDIISHKKNIIFLIISLLFIIGLFGLLFYSDYLKKIKNKTELLLAKERSQTENQIINAQETERNRIAQDLHDEVGNSLAALKNYVSQTNLELGDKINKIAQDVRNISHNLASIDFIATTLSMAFQNLVNRHNEAENIDYELIEVGNEVKLPAERELIIYRIVCELLNNIQKHSKAQKATIQLVYEAKSLTIIVEDDGIGIKNKVNTAEGIGLKHIQTRVAYLNGKLTIDDDGKGTIIVIDIPI